VNAEFLKIFMMKSFQSVIPILFFLTICNICIGQLKKSSGIQNGSLGAYWFVMYSRGSNWEDSVTKRKINQEHINYIVSLRESGKIITGGAFPDRALWTGFEIYNCKTREEVIKTTEADPMVLSKIFSYEIHPWMTLKGEVKFE
jgi:uncharacterized protein YciI